MLRPFGMIRVITSSTGRDLLGIALTLPFAAGAHAQFNPPENFDHQTDFDLVTENISRWGDITATAKSNVGVGGIPYTGVVFIDEDDGDDALIPFWLEGDDRAYDSARDGTDDVLLVVGSKINPNTPAVWVFQRAGCSWSEHGATADLQQRFGDFFKSANEGEPQYFSSVIADDANEQWLAIGYGIVIGSDGPVEGPVTVRIPYSLNPDEVEFGGPLPSDDRREAVGPLCDGEIGEFRLDAVWDLERAIPASGEPAIEFWVSGTALNLTLLPVTGGLATIDGLTHDSTSMPVQDDFLITPSGESSTSWYCGDRDPGEIIYCQGFDALPDGSSCGIMRWFIEDTEEEFRAWYAAGNARTVTTVLPWLDADDSIGATAMRATEIIRDGRLETRIVGLDRVPEPDDNETQSNPRRMNDTGLMGSVWKTDRAVEWKWDPDVQAFTAHDLNDRVQDGTPLRSANGINEHHDIIGMAFDDDDAIGFHGYLLTDDDDRINLDELALKPRCAGDLNGDGTVNGADFGLLLAEWGEAPSTRKDLNCDGTVNGSDVGLLLAAWGDCPDDVDG